MGECPQLPLLADGVLNTEYPGTAEETSVERKQWQREKIADTIIDFEQIKSELSQRKFAKSIGVPRSTVQSWIKRKEELCAIESPELVKFFESPAGAQFLHRIVLAAHYEFCEKGPASIHNVSNYLKRCGLEPFIGTSYSTQRNVAHQMDEAIVAFEKSEQDRLKVGMPVRMKPFILPSAWLPWTHNPILLFWRNTLITVPPKPGTVLSKRRCKACR